MTTINKSVSKRKIVCRKTDIPHGYKNSTLTLPALAISERGIGQSKQIVTFEPPSGTESTAEILACGVPNEGIGGWNDE